MDNCTEIAAVLELPPLPVSHGDFISYLKDNKNSPMNDLLAPFNQYDNEMRKVFAQQPDHPAARVPSIVPLFNGHEDDLRVRARDLASESEKTKDAFIMPLSDDKRLPDGSLAVVSSLSAFRTNFNVFSESSLVDLDWSNVVAAGSAVVTSLLAIPEQYAETKRGLREYFHEKIAPASDVDLFLYGLSEDQAKAKIRQIESSIRNAILTETTTVRTKNAITIVSQHPTRHVQVVLRVYKSISEILTGFDVDCSCAAFDGKQVYASPRAIASFMTQTNTIDLSRRSPSYESRLSKYAHRGFEISWPDLDRSRIDPTIFERSFGRTEGLSRLLVLEKLPKSEDRESYLDQRRLERGRPAINRWRMRSRQLRGNIKDAHEDEVADWVNAEDVSDYHTFTIPYGPKFHARNIEKLLFTKDMLLNAEWNLPKDREVQLHRHPAFFGRAEDVFHDCCGSCPQPKTVEEEEVSEQEKKIFVSGCIEFIKDDPGRQAVGSFHPITPAGWTEMAYVGNTQRLCQGIVEGDVEYVRTWLEQEGNDPNTRDFTGRTPLHLAVTDSTPEVVQVLIDHDARLVARLVDGRTALHLAAIRGNVEMISALLRRSEANDEEEQQKIDARRATRIVTKDNMLNEDPEDDDSAKHEGTGETIDQGSDIIKIDLSDESSIDATTEASMVNVKPPVAEADDNALAGDGDKDGPDVYDVNVLAWDTAVSPLHLAIVNGHVDAVRCLVEDFGADLLLPVKLFHEHDKSARAAVLTLVLAMRLPIEQAEIMTQALIKLGASCAQADMDQTTALQYAIVEQPDIVKTLFDADRIGVSRAINHLSSAGYKWNPLITSPLMTAINARDSLTALSLLGLGAKPEIDFGAWIKAYQSKNEASTDTKHNKSQFQRTFEQPVICAVQCELPDVAQRLIEEYGADINTLTKSGWSAANGEWAINNTSGRSLLDEVRIKIENLATWKPKDGEAGHPPIALQQASTYFSGLSKGSYAWWSAQKQVEDAEQKYARDLKAYQQNLDRVASKRGLSEKQAAINSTLTRFEALEKALVQRGAKTFHELYPDIKEGPQYNQRNYTYNMAEPKPFRVEFGFQLPDLTDEMEGRYMRLFEAAWKGDRKLIKELTLLSWKSADGEDQPPLKLAVMDQHRLSPFAIAVLHGQRDLATLIMDIAQAQYVAPDAPARERHRLADADEDDSDSGSDLQIVSELVDATFTIENVGQVSTKAQSSVSPRQMLLWTAPVSHFRGERSCSSTRSSVPAPNNLLQFAVHFGDEDLLDYLLTLGENYAKPDDTENFLAIPDDVYQHAISIDSPHILSKLIKRTGAGIPLDQLLKQSGIEVKGKSKYYQGLSVYGKKRRDWAARGSEYRRNYSTFPPLNSSRPPLLQAARHGSLETVEWLLTDAPIRCYNDFSRSNSENKRIIAVSGAPGGFEACVRNFLGVRSHLIMHCCVMGEQTPESTALLRYLVKTLPDDIDARSQDLMTPLLIAFRSHHVEAAKILIAAGADQTARDKTSNNILHHLFKGRITSEERLKSIPIMLELIDERLLPSLFLERSAEAPGSLTPFAQVVNQPKHTSYFHPQPEVDYSDKVLRTILKYSNGAELDSINGEGHTPLHVAVRECDETLTRIILEHDPTLLLRENATGRTPFEMEEDIRIASFVNHPPNLNIVDRRTTRSTRNFQTQSVCDQQPENFVVDPDQDRRGSKEKIRDMLQKAKNNLVAEGRAQRRLVTLNEANEVAKRLATKKLDERRYRGRGRDGYHDDLDDVEEEQNDKDEVQMWLPA